MSVNGVRHHLRFTPPEAAHSVTNFDAVPLHLIRVDVKNGFPKDQSGSRFFLLIQNAARPFRFMMRKQ